MNFKSDQRVIKQLQADRAKKMKQKVFTSMNPVIEDVLNVVTDGILQSMEEYKQFISTEWAKYDTSVFKFSNAGITVLDYLEKGIGPLVQGIWNHVKKKESQKNDVEFEKYEQKLVFNEGNNGVKRAKKWCNKRLIEAKNGMLTLSNKQIHHFGKLKIEEEMKKNNRKILALFDIGLDVMEVWSKDITHALMLAAVPGELHWFADGVAGVAPEVNYAVRQHKAHYTISKMDESVEEFVKNFGDYVIDTVTKYFRKGQEFRKCALNKKGK